MTSMFIDDFSIQVLFCNISFIFVIFPVIVQAKKRQIFLEETYGGSMRELELLFDNFQLDQTTKKKKKSMIFYQLSSITYNKKVKVFGL